MSNQPRLYSVLFALAQISFVSVGHANDLCINSVNNRETGRALEKQNPQVQSISLFLRATNDGRPYFEGLDPSIVTKEAQGLVPVGGKKNLAEAFEGSQQGQYLKKELGLISTATNVYDNRVSTKLMARFGVRHRQWESLSRPDVSKDYVDLMAASIGSPFLRLEQSHQSQSTDVLSISGRREIIPSSSQNSFNLVDAVKPPLSADVKNAILSLEMVTADNQGTEVHLASLVLERLVDTLPPGYHHDFRGATIGTGQDGANGKILISPKIGHQTDPLIPISNQSGLRQILILNNKLEVEEALDVKLTETLQPITYLSMDNRFIYAAGHSSVNGRQFLMISRETKSVVLNFQMPLELIGTPSQNTHNFQQTQYRFFGDKVQAFQVTNVSVNNFVVSFTGIKPDGNTEKYSVDLRTLLMAVNSYVR